MAITSSIQNNGSHIGGRQALVIGAIAYPAQKLDNAVDDAMRVAKSLEARGFVVTTVLDPDKDTVETALATFRERLQTAKLAMIFIAGHAVELHGSGYFLPVDFNLPLQPASLPYTAVSLNAFVDATKGAESRIVVLDACRIWPRDPHEAWRVSDDLDQLLADQRDWPNLLLAYATSATTAAGDGAPGVGSTFALSLCGHLLDHSLTVDECFRRVSQDVVAKRRQQQPWTYSSLALTLSFTDLPRFSAIQRHSVPNSESLSMGAWTIIDAESRGVIVGVGDAIAWHVDMQGFRRVGYTSEDRLMGAADFGSFQLLAGSQGALYEGGGGSELIFDLEMKHTHGLSTSPSGSGAIYYGDEAVCFLEVSSDVIKKAAVHNVGFGVYSCIYMPDGRIWVAGENGRICEIDPHTPDAAPLEIAQLSQHINAMAVTSTGDRVFIVGQSGLAVELDRSGRTVAPLLQDRRYKTAAGIRARLLNLADDEIIYRFIFDPTTLKTDIRENLTAHIGVPNFPSCALAPTLPILAVATQESSVVLLDTRDLQVIQELDVGSGNSSMVAGVHFLSDKELVVIGGRGEVTFFGA